MSKARKQSADVLRDAVLRRILGTPPKLHKSPAYVSKSKMRPAHKGRVSKGKSRA
jgi:hypothetical protein